MRGIPAKGATPPYPGRGQAPTLRNVTVVAGFIPALFSQWHKNYLGIIHLAELGQSFRILSASQMAGLRGWT